MTSIRGHHFLAGPLNPGSVVVDLGAHRGEFAEAVVRRFGCRCYAVEANGELCAGIKETSTLRKFNCAIWSGDGPVGFVIDQNVECSRVVARPSRMARGISSVRGVRLETFLGQEGLETVDLLKVDIEGAEIPVLRSIEDRVLRRVSQLTVEFHDFMTELQVGPEVDAVMRKLRAAGFASIVFSGRNRGDVLFVNREAVRLSRIEWAYLENVARYTEGLGRAVRRWLGSPD